VSKMILSFGPDIILADPKLDFVGSNILHLACYNGASAEAINFVLNSCNRKKTILLTAADKDGRVPLHTAVECICRDKIVFEEGMQVIEALYDAAPLMIHAMDEYSDTPIDLVVSYYMGVHVLSPEYKRLIKLYQYLRVLGIKTYMDKKKRWEEDGYCKVTFGDHQSTQSTLTPLSPSSDAIDVIRCHFVE